MKKRWIAVAAALGIGLMVIPGASAQTTTTTPKPFMSTVGVMVDSINGDTSTVINCWTEGYDGRFASDLASKGDATLLMVNRKPHLILCAINIKSNQN